MKITIDRFENEFAVVLSENGESCVIPKILLENGKEGDVFNISFDKKETDKRSKKMKKLIDEVWE